MFREHLCWVSENGKSTTAPWLQFDFKLQGQLPFSELLCCDVALGRFFEHKTGVFWAVRDHARELGALALHYIYRVLVAFVAVKLSDPWVIKAVVAAKRNARDAGKIQLGNIRGNPQRYA